MIQDKQKRQFKKLRVSLVGNCNFACSYCVPEGKNLFRKVAPDTSPEKFLENILKIHKLVNLESVRLTGGEPTLYKDLPKLVYYLKNAGIPKVSLTTNGSRLFQLHKELADAKLDAVNVSLDSIDSEIFQKINHSNRMESVLAGIESILNTNISIKINCTVMKGYNESQILPIVEWGKERNITVRFLELMKMGHLFKNHAEHFFSKAEILEIIQRKYTLVELGRKESDTCAYWQIPDSIKVGIISNHSQPFCSDCDRLRMDQHGNIYGCLSVNTYFPMEDSEELLHQTLSKAMNLKKEKTFSGSSLSMQAIGG